MTPHVPYAHDVISDVIQFSYLTIIFNTIDLIKKQIYKLILNAATTPTMQAQNVETTSIQRLGVELTF